MAKYKTVVIPAETEVAHRGMVTVVIKLRDKFRPLSKGWKWTRDLLYPDDSWNWEDAENAVTALAMAIKKLHTEEVQFISGTLSPWQGEQFFDLGSNTVPVLFDGVYGERGIGGIGAERSLEKVLKWKVTAPPGNLGEMVFRGCIGKNDVLDAGDEQYVIADGSDIAPGGDVSEDFKAAMIAIPSTTGFSPAMIGRPLDSEEWGPDPAPGEKKVLYQTMKPVVARIITGYANLGIANKQYGGG